MIFNFVVLVTYFRLPLSDFMVIFIAILWLFLVSLDIWVVQSTIIDFVDFSWSILELLWISLAFVDVVPLHGTFLGVLIDFFVYFWIFETTTYL